MLPKLTLSACLAVVILFAIGQAAPSEAAHGLETRNNKWNLNCSNAPDVVAGNLVNQSDYILSTELQYSGSNQKWLKYLWCTVGTETYTFLGMGDMTPAAGNTPPGYRNLYQAFNQAAISVSDTIEANGGDGPLSDGWTMRPPNTNIEIGVQSAVGTMTYGVLESALTGLKYATSNYNPTNAPMLFQINDGRWGELGIGYAGYVDVNSNCVYEITPKVSSSCSDVGKKGGPID